MFIRSFGCHQSYLPQILRLPIFYPFHGRRDGASSVEAIPHEIHDSIKSYGPVFFLLTLPLYTNLKYHWLRTVNIVNMAIEVSSHSESSVRHRRDRGKD